MQGHDKGRRAQMNIEGIISEISEFKMKYEGKERFSRLTDKMKVAANDGSRQQSVVAAVCAVHLLFEQSKSDLLIDRELSVLINTTSKHLDYVRSLEIPGISRLIASYHIILGKIYAQKGRHWESGFQNFQAFDAKAMKVLGGVGNKHLAYAINALRLGFGDVACQALKQAKEKASNAKTNSIRLSLIKALRVCERFDELEVELSQLTASEQMSADEKLEMEWEILCLQATKTQRWDQLIRAGSKAGTHNDPSYILEGKLWSLAVRDPLMRKLIGKVKYVAKDKAYDFRSHGFTARAVLVLDDCYDEVIPQYKRVANLCEQLDDAKQFPTIDREQLYLIASARWFAQEKLYQFAVHCLLAYRKHSMSLTNGRSRDNLNLAGDLFKTHWFNSRTGDGSSG